MNSSTRTVELTDSDMKEIFSLFTSPSAYEVGQIYDPQSEHYFMNVDLKEEYSLTEPTLEYAIDAVRAVIQFIRSKGYSVCKDGEEIELSYATKF
ncbi:MAG: hypothetical protein M3362_28015 [Acidobacteriota bacterium]|nr:hypothetical protein [Acidobacteriota bacterium]